MKQTKKYILAALSVIGFQIVFGMSASIAAMDSKDWADLFEIVDSVSKGSSNSESEQKLNSGEAAKSRATPKYHEPPSQRKARNVNHCIGQHTKEKSIHYVNNCNFDIRMAYCHLNNENTDQITYACDQWYTNEINLKPGEVSYSSLKTGSAQILACRSLAGGNDNYSRMANQNIMQNLWPQKSKIDTYFCEASPQYR